MPDPQQDGIAERQAVDALSDLDIWDQARRLTLCARVCHFLLASNIVTAMAVLAGYYRSIMSWTPIAVGVGTLIALAAMSLYLKSKRTVRTASYRIEAEIALAEQFGALLIYRLLLAAVAICNIGWGAI